MILYIYLVQQFNRMLYSINILNITACREKHKKRRKSPQFEGTFGHLLKNIRPPQDSKSAGNELRYHHVVLTAGAVADQQLSVLPPAHHNSHMGIIRVEGQITGLGICLRNRRTVGVLGGGATAPARVYSPPQQWVSSIGECLSQEVPSI